MQAQKASKFKMIVLVCLIAAFLVVPIGSALAAPAEKVADMVECSDDVFTCYLKQSGPRIGWIAVLIVADLLLGAVVAIKEKVFDWKKVTDFLISNVLPKLGGFMVMDLLISLGDVIPSVVLPSEFSSGASTALFSGIVIALVASIQGHVRALGLNPEPVAMVLDKVGMKKTEIE